MGFQAVQYLFGCIVADLIDARIANLFGWPGLKPLEVSVFELPEPVGFAHPVWFELVDRSSIEV